MPANSGHNVDLLYDRPAALDADLIFGADYVPPRNDVVMRATLPLPVASVVFIPPARLELLAELPGLMVSTLILRPSVPLNVGVASLPGVVLTGEVRYASRTQRPTVGQTADEWQQAVQHEGGAAQRQQDATATPAGWGAAWQRGAVSVHGIAHRLPPVLVAAPLLRRTGQQQAKRQPLDRKAERAQRRGQRHQSGHKCPFVSRFKEKRHQEKHRKQADTMAGSQREPFMGGPCLAEH